MEQADILFIIGLLLLVPGTFSLGYMYGVSETKRRIAEGIYYILAKNKKENKND